MSKANKKLLAEIQNGLKQVDEGIAQLEMLEAKVENASTISIKEKYRQDMKREIKRLQRLRDIFRQNINNPAIVEQHRLVDARKRIETEMEKFRDHEKEYKSKRPTKAAMLNETEIKGKFNYGSGSDFDGEYGDEGEEIEDGSEDDLEDENETDINVDKQWLGHFVTDTLRTIMAKYDAELEQIQNKKTKGGQKKNRDKINALKAKKSHFQNVKDRAEELQISMDYLEPGKIRQLRIQSKQLNQNSDEEPVRKCVLQEIDNLIELSEQNRRAVHDPSNNKAGGSNQDGGKPNTDTLEIQNSDDIVNDTRPLSQIRFGNIMDAQDYLGTWHLSIVIDDGANQTSNLGPDQKTLHFLPFTKANRDETFSNEDQARLAPAFSKQEATGEPQTQIQTLQTYLDTHLRKTGQNRESIVNAQRKNASNFASHTHEEQKGRGIQNRGRSGQLEQNAPFDSKGNDTMNRNGMGGQQQTTGQANLQLQKGKHSKLQQSTGGAHEGVDHRQKANHRNFGSRDNANQDQQLYAAGDQDGNASYPYSALDSNSRSLPKSEKSQPEGQNLGMAPMFTNNFGGLGGPLGGPLGGEVDMYSMPGSQLDRQLNSNEQTSVLLQNPTLGGGLTQSPPLVKDTSTSERKHNLDLLETSFNNILTKQDQEVIDPKQPVQVWEEHDFPRVPLFNRKENFSKFDLETLFFAFYYQQGTYQQYLAAVELKKKNWKFVKKFETWFKKVEAEPSSTSSNGTAQQVPAQSASLGAANSNAANPDGGPVGDANGAPTTSQKDVGKYIFFDFENGWQQLVRDDFELDLSQIENELVVQPATAATTTAGSAGTGLSNPASTAQTAAGHTGAPTATVTTTANSSGAPSRTTHAQ